MSPAVHIDDLCFSYRDTAILRDLSFSIEKEEFFVILGPNGSGKTTLLKTMAGLGRIDSGNLGILGQPIERYSRKDLAKTVALVPQMVPLDLPFTVAEVVMMGRAPYLGLLGVEGDADLALAGEALAFTGVEHLAGRKVSELSGGERQRVIIAKAICQEPAIILLDEPTASLDLSHQVRIMDLMERMKNERGTTVVMVSHDINLAAMYADRILLLKDGTIASLGLPADVLTADILETTYRCQLVMDKNPVGDYPRLTLKPGRHSDM